MHGLQGDMNHCLPNRAVLLLALMIVLVLLTMLWVHHECSSPRRDPEFSLGPVVSGEFAHHTPALPFQKEL